MVFPVVMYGCESWTVKKAERRRIDAFELWWWRRLLRVPWTARRCNQSILKEISPGCSLEGMMLKAETPVLWPPEEGLGAGEGDNRGWEGWIASLTQWTWVWVNSRRWWWTGRPGVLQFMGSQRVGHDWATELNWYPRSVVCFFPKRNYGLHSHGLLSPPASPPISPNAMTNILKIRKRPHRMTSQPIAGNNEDPNTYWVQAENVWMRDTL